MKYNRIASIALIGSILFLAASCVEEVTSNEEMYRPAGTPIAFSAATSYQSTPETRAEYSGDIVSGGTLSSTALGFERIYWENGDKIRIVHIGTSTEAANYTVSSGTNVQGDRDSEATLSPGNLVWDGSGDHTFYGLYPCDNTTATKGSLTNGGLVSGSIPAGQNISTSSDRILAVTEGGVSYNKYQPNTDQYGFMAAFARLGSNSTVSTVRLPFRPAFTTFEFKLRRTDTQNPAISSFELRTVEVNGSTTPLTGGFSFQITGGDDNGALWTTPAASTITDPGYSITVGGFTGGEVHVPTTGYLDFSFLALPIQLTGVEFIIHYANGEDKTLKFKDNTTGGNPNTGTWHVFDAAKKYVITNVAVPGSDWEYIIEEINDITTYGHLAASLGVEVKSYRRNKLNNTIQAVSWKAQYWDGTTWQDWTSQQGDFSLNSYTGNGVSNPSSNHEDRTVGLTVNNNKESVQKTSIEILQDRDDVSNYDLSLHDVFGNGHTQTTANSYVITTSGTYRFPCVYGNAISNGSTNYESFAPGRSNSSINWIYDRYVHTNFDPNNGTPLFAYPDVSYVPALRNAINTEITKPYVIEDINSNSGYSVSGENVAIVWQDEQIMQDSDFNIITVDGHKYIEFSISDANIKPGNIIVALRGSAGGSYTDTKTILWSWQLWITDRDLTPKDGIMPANLGWNKIYNGSMKYTDRTLPIRLIQIAPNDDPTGAIDNEPFTVTQLGDSEDLGENVGSNPYYQWGRKDPMIPGKHGGTNIVGEPCTDKTIYPGNDYTGMSSFATEITTGPLQTVTADYGSAIRNPHVPFIASHPSEGSTSWISGYIPVWVYLTGATTGRTGAGFPWHRHETAIPYNLWNSYCFGYDLPGTTWGRDSKFKTVYDPCPPGFTVPYRGLQTLLGTGVDAPDHSGKNFTSSDGSVQFLPYTGARIFYNTSGVIPETSITVPQAGLYLRHVAGSTNTYGLYWTDCPEQFSRTVSYSPGLDQNVAFNIGSYNTGHFWSIIFMFTPSNDNTRTYTKGTGAAIRPMVDPRYDASTPSSPSAVAPNGSINPLGNYNNIPTE